MTPLRALLLLRWTIARCELVVGIESLMKDSATAAAAAAAAAELALLRSRCRQLHKASSHAACRYRVAAGVELDTKYTVSLTMTLSTVGVGSVVVGSSVVARLSVGLIVVTAALISSGQSEFTVNSSQND